MKDETTKSTPIQDKELEEISGGIPDHVYTLKQCFNYCAKLCDDEREKKCQEECRGQFPN